MDMKKGIKILLKTGTVLMLTGFVVLVTTGFLTLIEWLPISELWIKSVMALTLIGLITVTVSYLIIDAKFGGWV